MGPDKGADYEILIGPRTSYNDRVDEDERPAWLEPPVPFTEDGYPVSKVVDCIGVDHRIEGPFFEREPA